MNKNYNIRQENKLLKKIKKFEKNFFLEIKIVF